MGTEEPKTTSSKKPPFPPPGLSLIRARPRTSKVLGLDSPSPPPRSHVAVPFHWEDAPGKPKLQETAAGAPLFHSAAKASAFLLDAGPTPSAHDDGARECPVPLKLPPRLQATTTAAADYSLSPKTVLQGPSLGRDKKPPRPLRWSGSTASCRRKLGPGGAIFSWRKTAASTGSKIDGRDHDAAAPDASCCSPAASSASSISSSSSSMSYFGDDHSLGSNRPQADGHGREDMEDGEKGPVRITRLRRNRSLPSMATSHLWASIRKGIKQINPWS